ncbi:MAG TPA: AraC family transcriptional regulator [Steroidobacteraceae bacterium]|nr:AraC family transcriptional regulator [Steroidobacteraceae bacterium]
MSRLADALGAMSVDLPQPIAGGFVPWETLDLKDGIGMSVQACHTDRDIVATIDGRNLLKFGVQLSGQRILSFEGRHETSLNGAATAVLLHDYGVSKEERLIAHGDVRGVVVAMCSEDLWRFLDEEKTPVSSGFRSFLVRKRVRPRLAISVPTPEEIAIAAAVINCRRTGALRRLYVEAKATELFCLILDRFQAESRPCASGFRVSHRDRCQLAAVRDLLLETFVEPPSLHALARQFGLNRNKLCGGFAQLFGASIYDFCRSLRLEKARRLLMETDIPIAQVAYATGFSSASAFSASFTREFRRSPSRQRTS